MTRREALLGLLMPGLFLPSERWHAEGPILRAETGGDLRLTLRIRRGAERDSNTVLVRVLEGGFSDPERRAAEMLGRQLLAEWLARKNA